MKIRYATLILLLALTPALADWDMSGSTRQRWHMLGNLETVCVETTVEQHQITTHDGREVVLHFEAPEVIDAIPKLPGPQHAWPHAGCLMCLHNHLVGTHGQASDYLRKNGWGSWSTIHNNLHNDPAFEGKQGPGSYVGYNVGAPKEPSAFAPTPLDICEEMLKSADLCEHDIVYDLGCGDGRILIMAALMYNCRAVGLDIDPACIEQARENIERYGVEDLIAVYERDVRNIDIPEATVVTMYLMPELSGQLRPWLQNLAKGTRVIAHDKPIPAWQPDKSLTVESKVDGREHAIYRWNVAMAPQKSAAKCKT